MDIEIYERHMEGGGGYEHIAKVKWRGIGNDQANQMTRQQTVEWLDNSTANRAFVNDDHGGWVEVLAVHPAGNPAYVRTHANGVWTDNLLSLPTY